MVDTVSKLVKEIVTHVKHYNVSIGDGQNIIGSVYENGFEIDLPRMGVGKRYSFRFENSNYEAVRNEKGELDLFEKRS
jgi:hypothetical protein